MSDGVDSGRHVGVHRMRALPIPEPAPPRSGAALQARVLGHLSPISTVEMGELSGMVGVPLDETVRALQALERHGLAERQGRGWRRTATATAGTEPDASGVARTPPAGLPGSASRPPGGPASSGSGGGTETEEPGTGDLGATGPTEVVPQGTVSEDLPTGSGREASSAAVGAGAGHRDPAPTTADTAPEPPPGRGPVPPAASGRVYGNRNHSPRAEQVAEVLARHPLRGDGVRPGALGRELPGVGSGALRSALYVLAASGRARHNGRKAAGSRWWPTATTLPPPVAEAPVAAADLPSSPPSPPSPRETAAPASGGDSVASGPQQVTDDRADPDADLGLPWLAELLGLDDGEAVSRADVEQVWRGLVEPIAIALGGTRTTWQSHELAQLAAAAIQQRSQTTARLQARGEELEREREALRVALDGYADSDLASLATTLRMRSEHLEAQHVVDTEALAALRDATWSTPAELSALRDALWRALGGPEPHGDGELVHEVQEQVRELDRLRHELGLVDDLFTLARAPTGWPRQVRLGWLLARVSPAGDTR